MPRRRVVTWVSTGIAAVLLVAALGWLGLEWKRSLLPGTYNVMDFGRPDYGGGPVPPGAHAGHHHHGSGSAPGVSITELSAAPGRPNVRFRLEARTATIRLPSGREVDALTFNGRVPGPELRVQQGDLVQVTLVNRNVEPGVTIHWHGVDVPNAEDGVAGVTQDAVPPGGTYIYRFRATQQGTFWYHSHESSASQVSRGLFGAFVIEPRETELRHSLDLSVIAHDVAGRETLNGADTLQHRRVAAGTPVRLRLVNSDNTPLRFTVTGTPFRVVAIDGTDLNAPAPLVDKVLDLAAGGRYDVSFTMPATPVELAVQDTPAAIAFSADGHRGIAPTAQTAEFDPAAYGRPAPTPFGASSRFDRHFTFSIGRKPGFYDGHPGFQWTINGGIYPDVPIFVVRRGDLIRVTIVNHTKSVHPMHLHGHHMLVLSRNGEPVRGTPWWSDTLQVNPGETYDVAFRADNPGIWMDHCHNLPHAAAGLTMHVAYAGFFTPLETGGGAHNHPE